MTADQGALPGGGADRGGCLVMAQKSVLPKVWNVLLPGSSGRSFSTGETG